jgi:hypothetical protein
MRRTSILEKASGQEAFGSIQPTVGRRASMAGDSEVTEEKKGGFFRKLFKLAFIAAIVAGVAAIFKRRRGSDVDDVEWQELPPPAGG